MWNTFVLFSDYVEFNCNTGLQTQTQMYTTEYKGETEEINTFVLDSRQGQAWV
jgi:hypothetical protein